MAERETPPAITPPVMIMDSHVRVTTGARRRAADARVLNAAEPRWTPGRVEIVAHDATTGEERWRTRLVPAPGEPGDETWGGVPYEERVHVGSWMVPSYDPELDLIYVGTAVTSPAPKFLLGGSDLQHLYHNSTLALDADTGEIRWYYQHLNDHRSSCPSESEVGSSGSSSGDDGANSGRRS